MKDNAHTPQKMTRVGDGLLAVGTWVAWDSPQFGPCVGTVSMVTDDGWMVVTEARKDLCVWLRIMQARVLAV